MSTPSALTLTPTLWSIPAALLLGLAGLWVGHATSRLVRLFGPARPHAEPVRAAPSGVTDLPGQDSATPEPDAGEGALDEHDVGPPPPRCPHCHVALSFLRGLPAVADRDFRRRGRCPRCAQDVAPHRSTTVATVVLFALTGAAFPHHLPDWSLFGLAAVLWFVALGTLLSAIDLRVMRLPDAVVGPAYPIAGLLLAASVLTPPGGPDLYRAAQALVGMALITVLYWSLWRVHPRGLGFGDVKLSGLTGLYAGWAAGPVGALVGAFWAFAAFSVVGLVLMALRRATRTDPLPLGPFMIAATLATVLAGRPLLP
ncbi:A24 family peptidase [Nocardiopsis sp. MG754419]|uniref:prepilin peptidase n=1 Tax=Nocardiopsis sp. MG754419 TaxID=2259865 RepID=UPI001BA4AE3E|nr:A24 family peptidase [Nocardiopsis sp. MG754419]MBR8741588.1 prepilin peptidase [Nocardiopsis sp. MG754419]